MTEYEIKFPRNEVDQRQTSGTKVKTAKNSGIRTDMRIAISAGSRKVTLRGQDCVAHITCVLPCIHHRTLLSGSGNDKRDKVRGTSARIRSIVYLGRCI